MMGSALSSFFVGLFDIKHYFHLQVGGACLGHRWDLIRVVSTSYFSTPPSEHAIRTYYDYRPLLNLTGECVLVLAARNTISRISELEWPPSRRNTALQLWNPHWKAVWKHKICCEWRLMKQSYYKRWIHTVFPRCHRSSCHNIRILSLAPL